MFLEEMTRDVVNESRVFPEGELSGMVDVSAKKNTTGITLIRPGGRDCYPAFWIRDFAMSLEAGFITLDELEKTILFTAQAQYGPEIGYLNTGATIPPFAIADHILFDGRPVFFPGTYSPGLEQGGEKWGYQPPFDNHYYFIEMAYWYLQMGGNKVLWENEIEGIPLIERLHLAFAVPGGDKTTGMVTTTERERGVNFGFVDSVHQTGQLLFASLLKFRAAWLMKAICNAVGQTRLAGHYQNEAEQIKRFLPQVFATPSGWLNATTGIGKQYDVWGTAYATYLGILEGEIRDNALSAIHDAYNSGTIFYRGNVRHIPTTQNYSETSAWEKAIAEINVYQNGAYWGTASGWIFSALAQVEETSFSKMVNEYIDELMEGDYRKGERYGSPWECFHPQGHYYQNPVYMTSVTVPFMVLRKLYGLEETLWS